MIQEREVDVYLYIEEARIESGTRGAEGKCRNHQETKQEHYINMTCEPRLRHGSVRVN